MKCALAAVGFINGNIQHNKDVIISNMIKCADNADLVIFGEAFLQGFYSINFSVEHDLEIAYEKDSPIIRDICLVAKEYSIAVSFGFIEKEGEVFYSSQITIDKTGKVIDLYRRVSPGWKDEAAGEKYCEGKCIHTFYFMDKKIAVGLCGDLWFEDNINQIKELSPDIVLWPVYTDYNYDEWNVTAKYEYAEQAAKIVKPVLYVNSFCIDKAEEYEIAKGGACLFSTNIIQEIPSGCEGILIVEQ